MARIVILISRYVMTRMNRLEIDGRERLEPLLRQRNRGLITYSNHVSILDDPLLVSNFRLPPYRQIRWIAADALNFFGNAPSAWLFTAGKAVPIMRGAGLDQPGLHFLTRRLQEGAWVHIFPEGGRTRDPAALMQSSFKLGLATLILDTSPVALPFYHFGMHKLLPLGAKFPRRGHTVRLLVGEPLAFSGTPSLEDVNATCLSSLQALERTVHPAFEGASA
jgi:monolysocardiolipin acyltransferase